jgi:hypothetical protein
LIAFPPSDGCSPLFLTHCALCPFSLSPCLFPFPALS